MIGKLYVFEGIDGSGKTTLAKAVQAELTKRDVRCTYTKEPTDEGSKRLADPDICNPVESMLIFMQDRLRHTREMAKDIWDGKIVLCDRYYYSTIAYQSFVLAKAGYFKRPWSGVHAITDIASLGSLEPECTFLLDIPIDLAASRVSSRHSTSKYEVEEVQDHCDRVYRWMAATNLGGPWVCLDARDDLDHLVEFVVKAIGV
ncbi:MAG: dTMP kinase [Dehalococcoidales bacterium]|nr:dTMP kinase [Sphaerochaeta sp.]MDD5510730.1 dTMP kinase [Dehalococcoidales bacterium]